MYYLGICLEILRRKKERKKERKEERKKIWKNMGKKKLEYESRLLPLQKPAQKFGINVFSLVVNKGMDVNCSYYILS